MPKPLLPCADVAVETCVTMELITWSASTRRSAIELGTGNSTKGDPRVEILLFLQRRTRLFRMRSDDLTGG